MTSKHQDLVCYFSNARWGVRKYNGFQEVSSPSLFYTDIGSSKSKPTNWDIIRYLHLEDIHEKMPLANRLTHLVLLVWWSAQLCRYPRVKGEFSFSLEAPKRNACNIFRTFCLHSAGTISRFVWRPPFSEKTGCTMSLLHRMNFEWIHSTLMDSFFRTIRQIERDRW